MTMTGNDRIELLKKSISENFYKNKPLIISLLCTIVDSFDSLLYVPVRGGLRGFVSLLVPFFLPLTLVNNVKYVLKIAFSSPLKPSFAPLFLPFCRGEKCYLRHIFLARVLLSANNSWKNHFFLSCRFPCR